jgi:hypothetical protein
VSAAILPERAQLRQVGVAAAVAAAAFWIAFDGGSYGPIERGSVAVVAWWALVLGVALGVWPRAPIPYAALLTGGLIAAFAAWVGFSILWSDSNDRWLTEFDRTTLYLAVFGLAVVAARRSELPAWLAGLAVALAGIGVASLTTRLFPDLVPATAELAQLFPSAQKRLSYPVNYWNGLAALCAFALPLLLYFGTSLRNPLLRGLALVPLPALAGTVYLTSSRGGTVSALLAVLAFVALSGRRWGAISAVLWAGAGATAVVSILAARPELVDRPLESDLAVGQGQSAALLILLTCLGTGGAWALASRFAPAPPRVPRAAQAGLWLAVVLAAVAGAVALDPKERFERFKEVPPSLAGASVQEHLFSGSGNGRWQLWGVAVDEFQRAPVLGQGPGSYEAAWAQHGNLDLFVRDAHSLYLEMLAEVGVVGFVLLAGALTAGVVAGVVRTLALRGDERSAAAALVALVAAYLFEAGFDWMWELTVVSVVAFLGLGLLVGPATSPQPTAIAPPKAWPVRAALSAALVVLLTFQLVLLLAELKVRDSREAAEAGDPVGAVSAARAASALEPWASSPYLQLALAQELGGDEDAARDSIEEALERDRSDWRLWLVAARLQTKTGDFAAARASLAEAKRLNPRSDLFDEN